MRGFMSKQKGNALFLILIAVALFAALSYALTQSSRSGGGSTSAETASLQAGQIMQQAGLVQSAITHMRVISNCTDSQLSFENSVVAGYDFVTPTTCKVFDPSGGALDWIKPPPGVNQGENWLYTSNRICNLSGDCVVDPASSELMMVLPNVSLALCQALNRQMPDMNASLKTSPPKDDANINTAKFAGTYSGSALDDAYGANGPAWDGSMFGSGICFQNDTNQYWFAYVLIFRP
jgi:hypothetical protein